MRAIILDDEPNSAETLFLLLKKYCPEIQILAVENKPEIALQKIREHRPELLFLDIQMQHSTAFDLLPQLDYPFGVIFTTAFESYEYAHKAIRFDAIAYLTKPVDGAELSKAVEKAKSRLKGGIAPHSPAPPLFIERITVPKADGFQIFHLPEIVLFKSEGSYTLAIKSNGEQVWISHAIGQVEKMLEHSSFFRTHRSHLVNLKWVVEYLSGEHSVRLSNGDLVPLARDRKDDFFKLLQSTTVWIKS